MDIFGEPLETPEEAQATELCYDAMELRIYINLNWNELINATNIKIKL